MLSDHPLAVEIATAAREGGGVPVTVKMRRGIDDTVVGAGTKIDNLVMIAHNVRIGRLCMIAAQAGIFAAIALSLAAV